MSTPTTRLAKLSASLFTALTLSACNNCVRSGQLPSPWLPSPWPGYQGTGEQLTEGSAYGVSVGMNPTQALASVDRHFHRTGVFCGVGAAAEFTPDLRVPVKADGRPDTVCPAGDDVQQIWEADPSIFCGLCQAEILDFVVAENRVIRIEFRGTGCMLG